MTDKYPTPQPEKLSATEIQQLKKYARAGKAAEILLNDILNLNRNANSSSFKKSLAIFITSTSESLGLEIQEQDA